MAHSPAACLSFMDSMFDREIHGQHCTTLGAPGTLRNVISKGNVVVNSAKASRPYSKSLDLRSFGIARRTINKANIMAPNALGLSNNTQRKIKKTAMI